MRVLVACEFSGIVRDAFLRQGHDAISCDLLPSERPGPHIIDDVRNLQLAYYDLMVAFPPCTYLTNAGARWWVTRQQEQQEALTFFAHLLSAPTEKIAIENPQGIVSTKIRQPDQYIEPWYFGEPHTKKTGLWLKNLPKLRATNVVPYALGIFHHNLGPSTYRWKLRSRTPYGIASAMAEQWGLQ